jgi:hypothetical protein
MKVKAKIIYNLLLILVISSCSSTKQTVNYINNGTWKDVFANQLGYDLHIEIVKKSYKKLPASGSDSTKIKVITVKGQGEGDNSPPLNPGGDGITSTINLDITMDGSTKILVIPKGFKIIAISSQKKCYFILTKGYFFSKKTIKIK